MITKISLDCNNMIRIERKRCGREMGAGPGKVLELGFELGTPVACTPYNNICTFLIYNKWICNLNRCTFALKKQQNLPINTIKPFCNHITTLWFSSTFDDLQTELEAASLQTGDLCRTGTYLDPNPPMIGKEMYYGRYKGPAKLIIEENEQKCQERLVVLLSSLYSQTKCIECDQQERLHRGYAIIGIKHDEGQSTWSTEQENPGKCLFCACLGRNETYPT